MNQGKIGTIQGKECATPLHLDVVAIEKGAFKLLLTTVVNFTREKYTNQVKQKNKKKNNNTATITLFCYAF